jgi:hypothetical protein
MGGDPDQDGARSNYMTEYTAFAGGHGRFEFNSQKPTFADEHGADKPLLNFEQFLTLQKLLSEGQDAMVIERDIYVLEALRNKLEPDDPDFLQKAIMAIYEHAEGAGIPMAPLSEAMSLWSGEIFIFPNYLLLPQFGNCEVYRSRPYKDDPEWCVFDVWSLMTYPEGEEPERAELQGVYDKDDDENWGVIPRQDLGNIERQQHGMRSVTYERLRFSNQLEKSILNMHQELDRVIAAQV